MFFGKYKTLQSSSRYFVVSTLFLALLILLMGVVTRVSYVEKILLTNNSHKIHTQFHKHIGEILRLDEALTMSARLAASSGDLAWINRYDALAAELDSELSELKKIDPFIFEKFGGQSIKEANDALIKIEVQALEWVKKGNRAGAYALLMSNKYKTYKQDYLNGTLQMRAFLRDRVAQEALILSELGRSLFQWVYLAVAFFLIALATSSMMAILSIERNAKEREQGEIVRNQMVLVGELSALLNHEFKNLITILDFPIRSLKKTIAESAGQPAIATVEKIQNTFSRFSELIRAFGFLGKQGDLKLERVPVESAISDVSYFTKYLAEKKGIRFSVEYKGRSKNSFFFGNQILLTQTLLNLVKNSCDAIEKFSSESRWVNLEIEEKEGLIYFRIIDGGKGLLDLVKKKLFQSRMTTKGEGGTGLGLDISRKFSVIQGGRLEYDDRRENTTFVVTLKAA